MFKSSALYKKLAYIKSPYYRSLIWRPRANRSISLLNNKYVKISNKGMILCEGFWDNPLQWLRVAMLRSALAEQYGTNLLGLYRENAKKEWVNTLRSLPITAEECISAKVDKDYYHHAEKMLKPVNSYKDLYRMEFPDGYPTCHFYDGVLKREMIGQVEIDNPKLKYYLALILKYLDDFQDIINKYDIKAAIVSHEVTLIFSALVWKLLKNDIPVFRANHYNGHSNIKKLTKPEQMFIPFEDAPTPSMIRLLSESKRKNLIRLGTQYLDKLGKGKESSISMIGVYADGNLKYKSKNNLLEKIGCDPQKPLTIILGNSWPDFPNGYGFSYFTDYVDWFLLTYNIIKNVDTCNWLIKPHPAEQIFYGDKTTMKKLVGNNLPKGIYWWPSDASAVEIAKYADCIVTARGTSAIEHTAVGVSSIVAADNPYTDFNFVNYASNKEEYIELLSNAHKIEKPTKRQQEDAKIFAATFLADYNKKGLLRFPYADGPSYKYYRELPKIINNNKDEIEQEIQLMKEWSDLGHDRFNTYKILQYIEKN